MKTDLLSSPLTGADGPRMVAGDMTNVPFPTSVDAFHEAGLPFLNHAFHATGALAPGNSVVEIVGVKEFFGGGMGRKLWLDVRYARSDPNLAEQLFVKFTREFGDPLRELFSPVMEPEVRFALLSRRPDFPVSVPECYFGDYHRETKCGLLITARIPYGRDGVEPLRDKCLDYELPNPLEHYQALTRSMAALAAHHRAGRFGEEVDRYFPFDRAAAEAQPLIPYTAEQLQQKLDKLNAFAAEAPRLMSEALRDPSFLDGFGKGAMHVLERQRAIRAFLNDQSDMIALCHWNMNLDNGWFWREGEGTLQCGLLDWGGVSQMNLAMGFVGMTCAAETEFLARHEDDLMALLIDEYRTRGGPAIDLGSFRRSLKLAIALVGVAWMLDAPTLIEAEIPDVSVVRDRFDPALRDKFLPRAQLQLMTVFLDSWHRMEIGAEVSALNGRS